MVQKWVCAFCGHSNSVSAERLANPRNADMLFVPEGENSLKEDEATKPKEESKEGEQKEVDENDDSVLLFTIDISGSMGCTVAVSVSFFNTIKEAQVNLHGNFTCETRVFCPQMRFPCGTCNL